MQDSRFMLLQGSSASVCWHVGLLLHWLCNWAGMQERAAQHTISGCRHISWHCALATMHSLCIALLMHTRQPWPSMRQQDAGDVGACHGHLHRASTSSMALASQRSLIRATGRRLHAQHAKVPCIFRCSCVCAKRSYRCTGWDCLCAGCPAHVRCLACAESTLQTSRTFPVGW